MANEFRDLARSMVFGVPADPAKRPEKELMVEFGDRVDALRLSLEGQIEDIEIDPDSLAKATWADLSAVTGTRDGQRGIVMGPDAGTHTDPVTSETVQNEGTYTWVESGGWRWLSEVVDSLGEIRAVSPIIGASYVASAAVEKVGRPVAPSSGGATASNVTFVFADPLAVSGVVRKVWLYSGSASTLSVKRFSKAGDDFSQIGADVSLTVPSGYSEFDLIALGTLMKVNAGERIGFHCNGIQSKGATPSDGAGWYAGGPGNVAAFTDSTVTVNSQLQIGFEIAALEDMRDDLERESTRQAALDFAAGGLVTLQTIGRAATPVSGSSVSSATYAFGEAIKHYGFLGRLRAYAASNTSIQFGLYSRDGDFWRTRRVWTVPLLAGVNELVAGVAFPLIPVRPGDHVGFFTTGAVNTLSGQPNEGGGFYSSSGSAIATQFSRDSALTSSQLQIGFDVVGYAPVTAQSVRATLKAAFIAWLSATTSWNHVINYGQSNSVGGQAGGVIHTTPSIHHLTFNKGPKMTMPGLAGNDDDGEIKALEEDDVSPASGLPGSVYGETACSSFARHFSTLAAGKGTVPVWFASAAGRSATGLAGIGAGGAWYQNLLYHVQAAKAAADQAGKTYQVSTILFDHGENDQGNARSKDSLLPLFHLMIDSFRMDAKKITGQEADPVWLFTTSPYQITLSDGHTEAVLELCATRTDCHLVAPGYIFPHVADHTHLTAVGQALKGAYYARAAFQLSRARENDAVRWLGAYASGTSLTVKASAPTALAFNTSLVSAVTDRGFAVEDDSGQLTLSSISIGASSVDSATGRTVTEITMTLNRSLGANPVIRYAKDYGAASPEVVGGGAGNVFDTTPDAVTIDGDSYGMPHAAFPVTLPVWKVE